MNSNDINIIQGDMFNVIQNFEEEEFHAIVTDPPYNFDGGFMGREWDDIGTPKEYQKWCEKWARKCKRVLKPGGHLVAFGSNITHNRLMSGIEDAGFELRDTITWHYGEGFPGGSGQNVGQYMKEEEHDMSSWRYGLKPATEFIILARSPIQGSTASNVIKNETGVLNIPETRIGKNKRYPANLVLDEIMGEVIDLMSPYNKGGEKTLNKDVNSKESEKQIHEGYKRPNKSSYVHDIDDMVRSYGDEGGASRFFYCTKDKSNNNHPTSKPVDLMRWLVKLVTKENQKILDPFAGSGTTLLACKKENRNCTGIEINEKYINIIKRRLNKK